MTFTTQPPTKPGFYRWRSESEDKRNLCASVVKHRDDFWAHIDRWFEPVMKFGGEWCELVPKSLVEEKDREIERLRGEIRATWEEARHMEWNGHGLERLKNRWNESRAKRVPEGKE